MNNGLIRHYLPVFRHYLARINHLSHCATPSDLCARLSPDGFTALTHFATAQGYVLRCLYPLVGQPVPDFADVPDLADVDDRAGLDARGAWVLASLDRYEADAASEKSWGGDVRHQAGMAVLDQPPYDYIALYGAPNFFFHIAMGYAILRAQGVDIGKGDFDGFHSYPAGFSFDKKVQN